MLYDCIQQIMSSETSKPYKCQECGETFNSQSELQEHNNVQHVGTA